MLKRTATSTSSSLYIHKRVVTNLQPATVFVQNTQKEAHFQGIQPKLGMQAVLTYLDVILSDVARLHNPPSLYGYFHGFHR